MKRFTFWAVFVIVLGLIIWGLVVAMNKSSTGSLGSNPTAITSTDHVKGSGPVTLMEYGDFQCPACEFYFPIVNKVLADTGSSTTFVFRHFPLQQHPNAIPAALASEAADQQGKFWEMFDLVYANHADWTELSDPTNVFKSYATQIGLDIPKFTTDLASSTLRDKILASRDEGIKIGINATPTFFVNGKAITNPQSYDEFKAIITAAASSTAK